MIGYKAFDMALKCRGFQFEVGKTYDTGIADEKLELCTKSVFHFCRELSRIECVSDYKLSKSRVCEVVAEGGVVSSDDGKFGTNKIMILRELPRKEIEKYGNRNSGYRNSGDWNSGNRNSGYFNVDSPLIRIFGKETNVKIENIHFPKWLYFSLTQWVSHDTANDEEKKEHEREIELSGGFLKVLDYKEAFRLSWNKAKLSERKQLFALPNWDNEIFLQISGIDAEKEIAEEEK